MLVRNLHQRVLNASLARSGELLDRLASRQDPLWPHDRWPAMRFDRSLSLGAHGGHGPIRYTVSAYIPSHSVQFRFSKPRGFLGHHGFELEELEAERTLIRHIIEMRTRGWARLTWPLIFRPLHDALIEDALDRAEHYLGEQPALRRWSWWVKLLRLAAK